MSQEQEDANQYSDEFAERFHRDRREHGGEIETPAVVVLSGGNVDPDLFSRLVA